MDELVFLHSKNTERNPIHGHVGFQWVCFRQSYVLGIIIALIFDFSRVPANASTTFAPLQTTCCRAAEVTHITQNNFIIVSNDHT